MCVATASSSSQKNFKKVGIKSILWTYNIVKEIKIKRGDVRCVGLAKRRGKNLLLG